MNREKKKYIGFNEAIMILYMFLVLAAHAVCVNDSAIAIIRFVFLALVFSLFFCPSLLKYVGKLPIENYVFSKSKDRFDDKKLKITFYVIPFATLIIHYIAYYPGGFSFDSFQQYMQAVYNEYSDWHPVVHTLTAVKLPLLLTGGWAGSIVLFQAVVFSFVVFYALCSILKHTNQIIAIATMLLICLNPQFGNISMFVWKDVTFAMCAVLLCTFAMNIYFSDGEWIKSKRNMILFIVAVTYTTAIRHNAVLFTVPFVIAICFLISKKRAAIICLCVVILFAGIKLPVNYALGVSPSENRRSEMLGVPLSVIGAVVSKEPDSLDDETKEFAYKLAPKEVWENSFENCFNDVKYLDASDESVIDDYGVANVLKYSINCFASSPILSLKELIELTSPVYGLFNENNYSFIPYVFDNSYGIQQKGIQSLRTANKEYMLICDALVPYLFFVLGTMHLAILLLLLSKSRLNSAKGIKKALLVLPVFIYNFVTGMMLSGPIDSSRFFYYTFSATPILLVIILKNDRSGCEATDKTE